VERKPVAILIFPNVEILDFCGPYEVFSATHLNPARRREEPSPFEVFLVAETKNTITTTGGLKVIPDYTLEECPAFHILVVPGGWAVRKEIGNERLIRWISDRARETETVASVCTGAMLLGRPGLLDKRRATTHWGSLNWMRESFPNVIGEDKFHVIEEGNIITSAGISAGIDMALHVVMKYCGEAVARETARYMEYRFPDDNSRRV
jgi:transcriptional regulator GlxA family with amidase domain